MKHPRRYLFLACSGVIIVVLSIMSLVATSKKAMDFRVFMYGLQLVIFIVYTANYFLMYRKGLKKKREKRVNEEKFTGNLK